MATEVADQSSVELLRVVAEGRSLLCEAILVIDGKSILVGFQLVPSGVSAAVVHGEMYARLRALREAISLECIETERQAERRLRMMAIGLEEMLTAMPL